MATTSVMASDVVYVQSNVAGTAGNAVLAFRRDANGNLTPLPGSLFSTGGTGITPTFNLGPFDSDQEIAIDHSRRLLFMVNGGSDSIAVFRIHPGGVLMPVNGSPFPSGGSNPVSVGVVGNVLAVVNKDQNPMHPGVSLPNYTTFRIAASGRLTPIADSTYTVDAGSSPSQALIDPDHRILFGADFMGGVLRSFHVNAKGRLDERSALGLPPTEFAGTGKPPFPLGLAYHPKHKYLYVGFVTIGRMGVYKYDFEGHLQFVRTVANSGKAICWITTNEAGTRIYTSNTADNSLSVYDATQPADPVEIQHLVLKGTGAAFQIALDSKEKFFYAISQRDSADKPIESNSIHTLEVGADGKLTEVDSSPTVLPFSDGTRPQGVIAP